MTILANLSNPADAASMSVECKAELTRTPAHGVEYHESGGNDILSAAIDDASSRPTPHVKMHPPHSVRDTCVK
jgi:hypothetical protein